MRQIFVFTAGDKEARKHLADSISNPVRFSLLDETLPSQEAEYLRSLMPGQDGFFAWGAVEGPRNKPTWKSMQVGDLVLTVFDNQYHYFSSVVSKLHNPDLAERIWGLDDEGKTWEYMYFLSPPQPINAAVNNAPLGELLNSAYRGFTRISHEKTARLVDAYGSLDAFVDQVLGAQIPPTSIEREVAEAEKQADADEPFDPTSEIDGRRKILRAVVSRQGQPKFRKNLLIVYEGRCVVTGCDIEAVLQAAHIKAYDGANSNAIQNGLLLRADIHTLFDLGHLKVDGAGVIHLHESLENSVYKELAGRKIRAPKDPRHAPHPEALEKKYSTVL